MRIMKFNYYFIACFSLLVFVSDGYGAKWNKDDEEGLQTKLELDEYDFEDVCGQNVVTYEWADAIGNKNDDKTLFDNFVKIQKDKADLWIADRAVHTADEYPPRTIEVSRKLDLVSRPGDTVLPQEKYSQLLEFESAIAKVTVARQTECEKTSGKKCALTSRDPKQLLDTWRKLELFNSSSDIPNQYPEILKLLSDAAKANGFSDVRAYWLMLSELNEDGYEKAEKLWSEVRPLYQKFHNWVSHNLRNKFGSVNFEDHDSLAQNPDSIPSHLLGTTLGMDWTNIADLILTKECKKVYSTIQSSLKERKIAGKELFQITEKMTEILKIGKLPSNFWKYSLFNQTCPSRPVDPCKKDLRVAACNEPSWLEYLNAHEITMQGIHTDLSDSLSYLLKNGNRYSALDPAIAGLATIIASNRHYLAQQNLLNLPENNCVQDALLILTALRELPKIPYYLVADKARLEAIEKNEMDNISTIWHRLRLRDDLQGLLAPSESDWWGFLEDPHIAANRPYISHFYGAFLKFQLFDEMLMRDEAVSATSADFINSRDEFRTLLGLGKSKRWPKLLEDTFQLKSVTSAPLLRFFSRLDLLITPTVATNSLVPKALPTVPPQTTVPTVLRVVADDDEAVTKSINKKVESTSPPSKVLEESGGVSAGTILFILCAIIMAIALIVAIVNYSRKRFQKNKQYQRPPNQNQPV